MLQLPEGQSVRFSRAHVADMARGAKAVKVKAKRDPVIALINSADVALVRYIVAKNTFLAAKEKLHQADRGWPWVSPIDQMIPEWSRGDRFVSVEDIDRKFRRRRLAISQQLKKQKQRLKLLRPGHGHGNLRIELEQGIASCNRILAEMPKWIDPMKRAFRVEARRLATVQRSVQLDQKRDAEGAAWIKLSKLTRKIGLSKPTTTGGALAILAYVETRCREDLIERFSATGSLPASFDRLLRRARQLLERNAK